MLSLCLVTIYGYSTAHAEHTYFDAVWKWDNSPVVCLDNIPAEDKYMTLRGAHQWEKALTDYTNSSDWDYQMILTEGDITGCNIVVQLVDQVKSKTDGRFLLGLTVPYLEKDLVVIYIDRDFNGGELYHDTVVHELGHALGIGHRLALTEEGFISNVISGDIMIPTGKKFLNISKESLDAMIYFNTIENSTKYFIPHNGTWDDLK